MPSAWTIDGIKYSGNSTKQHIRMSLGMLDAPLLRPVRAAKYSNYASIVRYGTPQVFIDELWYADEMIARVTKTDPNIIEFEVFNPCNIRLPKLMCASRLLHDIRLFGGVKDVISKRREGIPDSSSTDPGEGYSCSIMYSPIRTKQLANVDASAFQYRVDEVPVICGLSRSANTFMCIQKKLDNGNLHVLQDLEIGAVWFNKTFSSHARIVMAVHAIHVTRGGTQTPPSFRNISVNTFVDPSSNWRGSQLLLSVLSVQVDGSPISFRPRQSPRLYPAEYWRPSLLSFLPQ